jgi:cytoskeleton protein RodZ
MSQDADPSIEEVRQQARREGPGAHLRDAREAAGLSREDVARSLNLEKAVVEALECDDVERLPEPAYVKGYLRAYARLLDLDANELLQAYSGLAVQQPEVLPRESASTDAERRVRVQVVGGLIILILIVVSAWWLTRPKHSSVPPQVQTATQQTQQTPTANAVGTSAISQTASQVVEPRVSGVADPANGKTDGSAPSAAASAGNASKAELPKPTTPVVVATSKPGSSTQTPSTPSVSSSAPSTTASPSAGVSGTQLVLQLIAKSWVQIDDGRGTQLFRGLLDAGTKRTFSGTPPFSVFLGYAPGVTLHVDGKQVSAVQYTQSNSTARFKLLADGRTRR